MITAKIKRKSNNLKKLKQKIESLSKKSIKSGLFSDQGKHPTANIPYTDLAYIHHFGTENIPPRDIRYDVIDELQEYNFKPVLNSLFYKKESLVAVLDSLAFKVEDISKDSFGVPSVNNPDNSEYWQKQKGGNTPLLQYGHLRDAWTSRIVDN